MPRARALAVLAVALGAWPSAAAAGEVAVGVELGTGPDLVRFDTAAPGTLTARVPVTGLLAGETLTALDMRPSTGGLFALTSLNRMLLLEPETGAAQQLGAPIDTSLFSASGQVGFDFNPTVDRLRLVSAGETNLRFNPLTFLPVDSDAGTAGVQGDTNLAFIGTDTHFGADPSVVAEAYTNNDNDPATPTTLFAIESAFDILVRQGGVDGAGLGGSPNGGLLTTIGALGVDVADGALDVVRGPSPGGNVAWAALRGPTGGSTLYTVALATGTATSRGAIGGSALNGLAILVGGAFRAATTVTAASEASTAVSVQVTRTGDTLAPASVGFRTADRTAVAGSDYTPVTGTLDFAQGERTKAVAIALRPDAAVEGTEALSLLIGPASVGAVVDTREHTIQIADDDTAPAPADRVRPALLLAPTLPDSLRALNRARRLRLELAASEACTVQLFLKLGRTRLGASVAAFGAAGVKRMTVGLTRAGRRAISRALRRRGRRTVTLALSGVATDAAGNRQTRTARLRLSKR